MDVISIVFFTSGMKSSLWNAIFCEMQNHWEDWGEGHFLKKGYIVLLD